MQGQELSVLQFLEILCSLLSFGEYNNLFVPICFNVSLYMFEHLLLALIQNRLVLNTFRYLIGVVPYKIDQDRVVKSVVCELLNESGHCRREDHVVNIFLLQMVLDLKDVLLETHIQHLVTLIQDLIAHIFEVQSFILEEINESSRCAYQNIRVSLFDLTHYNKF
jgi:hypothetical protein